MKESTIVIFVVMIVLVSGTAINAQMWNSSTGGYSTGYGTVYGSWSTAMWTQGMYNTMENAISKATLRQSMINKWGLAAVEKAEREAGSSPGSKPANSRTTPAGLVVTPRRIPKNYGVFTADPSVDTGTLLADKIGDSADEKALIKNVYLATKAEFEKSTAAKGWKNNVAGALTFFILYTTVIYHDAPEPGDESAQVLYSAVSEALDELPEFGKMSNKEKQSLYNTLIGFTGLAAATYAEGKQNGDAATVKTAAGLAGMLIKLVLKKDPENVQIRDGVVTFAN
jgi:hypothetical protein